MHDFAQAGPITTLPQLNGGHLAQVESTLAAVSSEPSVVVVLPCHGNDLGQPALQHIADELRGAAWIREIVLSMNSVAEDGEEQAQRLFANFPCPVRLLRNDEPELRRRYAELLAVPEEHVPRGKGFNVWAAVGALEEAPDSRIVAVQDCDVASFRRVNLARLCLACAHPDLQFAFAKLYYARVTDRLYGRATRLFFTPLLEAVSAVYGATPMLDYLRAFRYALAGECAMTLNLARRLAFSAGYGLEVQLLGAVYHEAGSAAVCQVDGGTGYDHKHHPAAGRYGLGAICAEVAEALAAVLGVNLDGPRMKQAYREAATISVERSRAMAVMNGLPYDAGEEQRLVEIFASALSERTNSPASLPPWSRITHGIALATPAA